MIKKIIIGLIMIYCTAFLTAQSQVEDLRNILIQNEHQLDSFFGKEAKLVHLYSESIDSMDIIGADFPISEVLKLKEFKSIVEKHPAICTVSDGGVLVLGIIKKQNFPFELIQVQSLYFGVTSLILECYIHRENIFISYACGKDYGFEEIKVLRKRGENLTDWW